MDVEWEQLPLFTGQCPVSADMELLCGLCGWPVDDSSSRNRTPSMLEPCEEALCPQSTGPTTTPMLDNQSLCIEVVEDLEPIHPPTEST